jgi:Na+/H+-dicarboxylate symporter
MTRLPLYVEILGAMGLGAAIGLGLNAAGEAGVLVRADVLAIASVGERLGLLFLSALNMVVVPLIFASLVSSITGLKASGGNLRRLGTRTIAYYLTTSFLAIGVGILVVNVVQPGVGMDFDVLMSAARSELDILGKSEPDVAATAASGALGVLADIAFRMVPSNIVEAATSNRNILSVIFFSVCFGIAALKTGGETLDRIDGFFSAVFQTMITLTNGILLFAPVGIFGYILFVTASTGLALAASLAWYMVAVAIALALHAFVTLPLLYRGVTGRSPLQYAAHMKEALLTAFSTASSSGTLPLTMRCANDNAGLPKRVTSFTLPLGATVNMDGTALYEAVAVLFVAQMQGGLTLGQQVVVAVTALLASVGAAGIPHAGTVMMVIVMQAVGLPTESVLVILAVDRVLDMARTTVNVWSDSVGAAIVSHLDEA